MKKQIVFIAAILCAIGLLGCGSDEIDRTKPVFETDNICSITFFTPYNYEDGIDVPSAYMDEIIPWLASFRVDKKAGEMLIPGTNSISFRIEYADGTILENGLSTTTIDDTEYYLKSGEAPPCYLEIISADWNS